MNAAARAVMAELPDITIAYGVSDEYRHVSVSRDGRRIMSLTRRSALYSIRPAAFSNVARGMISIHYGLLIFMLTYHSKLVSTIVSTFTAYYVHLWSTHFPGTPLSPPLPSFDGRAVCYPTVTNLRDYMSWRQVDCKSSLAWYYALI